MPPFRKPSPPLRYQLRTEKAALDDWFENREVPFSSPGRLLIASWNVANLGNQKRSDNDLRLIAHLLARFDLIALQEVHANFRPFVKMVEHMGPEFDFILNDTAGNAERLAFIYRTSKVKAHRLFGEVAIPKTMYPKYTVVVPYTKRRQNLVEVYFQHEFVPFDRNPFIGTFEAGRLSFSLVNVHLYFGAFKNSPDVEERAKFARRVLEIFTLSRWAKSQVKGKNAFEKSLMLIGDMNVPAMDDSDPAYKALLRSGLQPTNFFSKTGGSNLSGSKTYDQLAISPGKMKDRQLQYGVFDFDNRVFAGKWRELAPDWSTMNKTQQRRAVSKFNSYVKYHLSDHRPLWMELDIS